MRARIIVLSVLVCMGSLQLLGQAGAGSETPASAADIRKLFEVMQIRAQMKLVMQQVYQQMRSVEREQIKKQQPNVTEEDMAKIDAIAQDVLKGLSTESLLDDMVPVYQKHLTKADVDAMIGFYSTATGQKILKEMPAMTTEGMQAMQPHLRQMMDEASSQMEKRVREQMQEKNPPSKPAVKD
ncbi:MAG TPA: DUF2059 domain-containing protein [Dongiaceae bacterium]|nr:DUF2059 domain-containing protein [Dongiaceae bacterium]